MRTTYPFGQPLLQALHLPLSPHHQAYQPPFLPHLHLLRELGFTNHTPVKLYADNRGAKDLAQKAIVGRRSKHIDIKYHSARDMVEAKQLTIVRIPSEENVADPLTKSLVLTKFVPLVDKMGFTDSPELIKWEC